MAASDTNGLTTVLRMLAAQGGENSGAAGEQEDLFEADAPLPLGETRGVSGPKGGRPRGARNRSTDEWVRMFLSRYRSPLTQLAEIAAQDTEALFEKLQAMADRHPVTETDREGEIVRRVLRIDPLQVLKVQRDAAAALLPYIHKQQAKAVEIESKPRGLMVLDLGAEDGEEVIGDDLALPLAPSEQNQGVGEAAGNKSDGGKVG